MDLNEDLRVAVKVDGSWFVSQDVLNNTALSTWENVGMDIQSASWNNLTFVSGSTLIEGGAAGALSGTVQAIGVYDADATGEKVRLDNFTVEAIPEPATLSLIGCAGLLLVLCRRKLMM